MTQQQITNKIAELEKWLHDNSPEHEARPNIEADLRKLKEKATPRTIERDTFDLREHNFYNV
ncbi:hypothetical protein [Flavobacterium fluviatile]|uniref:hypothetical protein n=1 Tax=Flavobacterium fluviatile TaxID=1862387 RepID=UPI0013D42C81|nr:hypothetical protein [Flavobacterium fluviatile]